MPLFCNGNSTNRQSPGIFTIVFSGILLRLTTRFKNNKCETTNFSAVTICLSHR